MEVHSIENNDCRKRDFFNSQIYIDFVFLFIFIYILIIFKRFFSFPNISPRISNYHVILSYDLMNKDGRTALAWAAERGNHEVFRVLIHAGADANLQDKVSTVVGFLQLEVHSNEIIITEYKICLICKYSSTMYSIFDFAYYILASIYFSMIFYLLYFALCRSKITKIG